MKPTAAKIIAQLPSLSRAELSAVKGAADSLLGPQATSIEQPATPLLTEITRALGLKLGFSAFGQTRAYKQFKPAEQAIELFLQQNFGRLDRRTGQAIMGLMVDCLIADLKAQGLPLSMGVVCNNLMRAPQALRDAFPGYLESGYGQLIIDRIRSIK